MIVSRVPLSSVAKLPGPSAEEKFQKWTGDEIYPDEEEDYRQEAARSEVYFLKIPEEHLTNEKILVEMKMTETWNELLSQRQR